MSTCIFKKKLPSSLCLTTFTWSPSEPNYWDIPRLLIGVLFRCQPRSKMENVCYTSLPETPVIPNHYQNALYKVFHDERPNTEWKAFLLFILSVMEFILCIRLFHLSEWCRNYNMSSGTSCRRENAAAWYRLWD